MPIRIEHKTENGIELKRCGKCKKFKPLRCFGITKARWDGLRCYCKECDSASGREYTAANREKVNESKRKYRAKHGEAIIEYSRKYRKANAKAISERAKKFNKANAQKVKEQIRKYRAANREKVNEKAKVYKAKRYKTVPKIRLNVIMSTSIYHSLKGAKADRHWEDLVGYTLKKLIRHLEKQFVGGMSWENHGEWHIDHKIPISIFNFTKPEHGDFKRCWALKNLQPLWAADNLKKSANIKKHFQPSLLI